jgi:hypothetical protein
MIKLRQLVGKVIKKDAEMFIVFRVKGKYYPATDNNCEVMDTYMHTGDEFWLDNLEDELED